MLLLDTVTFIWLTSSPGQLSPGASTALGNGSDILLSDVSIWEICLKWQAKKIMLPAPPRVWVAEQARTWQLETLPIDRDHLYRTTELPDLHRDPFDRLLVAQALTSGTRLVTPDQAIHQYPVAVVW